MNKKLLWIIVLILITGSIAALTDDNIILVIEGNASEITYYTDAPYLIENIKDGIRNIEIRSNITYNNIKTYIDIPETKIIKKLYKDGREIEVNYTDTNNNDYYDKIEWISNSNDNFTLEVFNSEEALRRLEKFNIFDNVSMKYDNYYLESDIIKIERLTNLSDLKELYYGNTIDNVSTKIIAINPINIINATIKLEKLKEVNVILKCNEFNFNENKCNDNWYETDIKFKEDNNNIIFIVNEFSAYSGGFRRGLGQNLTYELVVGSIGMIGAKGNTTNYNTTITGVVSPIGNITAAIPGGYGNSTNYQLYLGYARTLEAGPNLLYCNVTTSCNDIDVFHIYSLTNAHVELSNGTDYDYKVCCKVMGNATLNNTCDEFRSVTILRSAQETNAHVELGNFSNYDARICLNCNEKINCAFKTDCTGYDTCVASVYQGSNSHLADCTTDPYSMKICCSISEYFGVAPVVILNKPIDVNNSVNFSSVTFNCSVTDGDSNVNNIELYSDFNGSWKAIESRSVSGSSPYELTTTHTISNNGRYFDKGVKWNCKATDSEGNVDWADSNFTFSSWDSGSYNNTRTDNINITLNYTDATNTSFENFGNYTSQVFGNNSLGVWNISFVKREVTNTGLNLKTRFSNDEAQWTTWSNNLTNPSGIINSSAKYIQYRAMLHGDSSNTPYLIAINVTYQRNIVPYNPSPLINSTDNSNSSNADLNCWFVPNDAENDTITCDVMWLKNNNSYWNNTNQGCTETLFINSLESENLSVAERWSCMARVCDDLVGCSNWVNSTQLFILGVSLSSPADKQNLSASNIRFKYIINDDLLDKCELFGNWSGSWANEQNKSATSRVTSEFDAENLSQGGYKWNVRCNRSSGIWTWADANYTFNVDLSAPNISLVNLTVASNGSIVNETIPISEGETFTITALISDAFGTINRVWAIIWDGVKGIGAIIWQGFLSLTGIDVWQVNVTINESFIKQGYNITIFANDTSGRVFNRTNITAVSKLVAYWNFDENNGTKAKDSSILSNNGTLYSGVNWTNDGAPGLESAVEFDGIGTYIYLGESQWDGSPANHTYEAWVYRKGDSGSVQALGLVGGCILSKGAGTTLGYQIAITDSDRKVAIRINSQNTKSASSITDNNWHHIAVVFNNDTNMSFYIDGIFSGSAAYDYAGDNNWNFHIGNYDAAPDKNYFNGSIDEIAIYNRTLSAKEIYDHYMGGYETAFAVNHIPDNPVPQINSTDNSNNTYANLNCYYIPYDPDIGDTTSCAIDWLLNNVSQFGFNRSCTNGTFFVDILESANTNENDYWSCMSRVCDSHNLCSNWTNSTQLVIVSNPPNNVSLKSPANDSTTTDRTPTFEWYNTTDLEGDTLTYQLQVSKYSNFVIKDIDQSGITETAGTTSYTPANDLDLEPEGILYYWRVRAYDGSQYGNWNGTWNFTITSVNAISLTTDVVNFSEMNPLESDSTVDNNPGPFTIQNDGNFELNVSIYANDTADPNLWDNAATPTDKFQFKSGNSTETGSFKFGIWSWTNVPLGITGMTVVLGNLTYTDTKDLGECEINVTVPQAEPPGTKKAQVVFKSSLAR